MRYVGSKRRVFQYIKPFLKQHVFSSDYYVEPFVGGANSLVRFDWHSEVERIAWDINPYLIAMWNELRLGWEPPLKVTEEQYIHIKQNKDRYEKHLVGYVGVVYSHMGKWFAGYDNTDRGGLYHEQLAQRLAIQAHKLKDVKFECRDFFKEWAIIKLNSIVYCDPPYKQGSGNGYIQNSKVDYNVYRELSRDRYVYISEQAGCMPLDFVRLMERPIVYTIRGNTYIRKEALYTYVEGMAWANQSQLARLQSDACP